MLTSDDSTSSDEELLQLIRMLPKPKVYHVRNNPLEMFDDVDFKNRYRFSKEAVLQFTEIFKINELEHITNRNFPISPITQFLLTLRFYATGSFQQVIGDHINIHKSSVCRVIPRITEKIASMAKQFISMPQTGEESISVMNDFFQIRRFPRVLGCIDCSHVKIISPGGANAEVYRNRKGWFSINTQAVCDAKLRIRDIVARWPGSVHDSTIFNSSALRARFESGELSNGFLLGDSGYACKNYLLTPVQNPISAAQEQYNTSHIQTRNTIERTFGVWKRRFPCLSVGLRVKPEKVVTIIVATAVLHNLAIDIGDVYDEEPINNHVVDVLIPDNNIPVRTALINTFFTN